jgi:Fe-S oxidoreductase
VQELFRRLRKIEPTIGLVLDCCGKISHDLGLTERFTALFERLSTRLKNKGITRILTACPGCSKILRKYGERFEVVSVYEIFIEGQGLKDQGQGSKDQGQGSRVRGQKTEVIDSDLAPCPLTLAPVVIHDPCPARFDPAQQTAVRQLVQSCGYRIEELSSHGQTTRCCGQGGMVEGCVPGTIKQESRIIAAEAAGRPVISSCAACTDTLRAATPAGHIVDLLTNNTDFSAKPVSSARRWFNRLKLRFARLQ